MADKRAKMWIFKKNKQKRAILALDYYDWFGFDCDKIIKELKSLGLDYHRIELSEAWSAPEIEDVDDEFLYLATIYTVCNELELAVADVDLGNPRHYEVYRKWAQVAKSCAGYIVRKIHGLDIAKIFIPQGYVLEAAVCRLLATRMSVPILAIENTLSKEKMLWEDIAGNTVNANLSKNYYFKYAPLTSVAEAAAYAQDYLANIRALKSAEHSTPAGSTLKTNEAKKIVLFLGQVYVDSSVLFGINNFSSQDRIIDYLCGYCKKNNYKLIVKLHPKEIGGESIVNKPLNKMTWRKLCNNTFTARCDNADIVIDHENIYDTYMLIEQASVCVTINSMSGLEARIIGKEVITCGYSSYGGLGFTCDAQDYSDLRHYLNKVLSRESLGTVHSHEDSLKFFYIYMNLYCVNKNESELARLLAR